MAKGEMNRPMQAARMRAESKAVKFRHNESSIERLIVVREVMEKLGYSVEDQTLAESINMLNDFTQVIDQMEAEGLIK